MAAFAGRFGRFLAVLGLTLWAGAVQAATAATGVRVAPQGEGARLVLNLSEPVEYSLFTLANPDRVVIELPELDWQVAGNPAGGLVERVRYARNRPGVGRVVIDLAKPARIAGHFILPPLNGQGHRLVLDLQPGAAPQAELRSPRPEPERQALAAPLPPPPAAKTQPRKPEKRVVVIDPGHGGEDPGTIGVAGTTEKSVTLAVALDLRRALLTTGRYSVFMTRDQDVFIPLRDRVATAVKANADLFISLHADSNPVKSTRGASVYTLSDKASDKEAEALAAKENKADLIAGFAADLNEYDAATRGILIDFALKTTMEYSGRFAKYTLLPELERQVRVLPNPYRFAGFRVLRVPNTPSVLVEMGYLSNREDEKVLTSARGRQALVAALARAVDRHFAEAKY